MTTVRVTSVTLADWAKVLLHERIPADISDPTTMEKAAALAKEFAATHPWAVAQGDDDFDLDTLLAELLPWARARGFQLLDDPPGCYPATPAVWVRCWGPEDR